jgi:Prenyltransferase and squalene oxidase repeat
MSWQLGAFTVLAVGLAGGFAWYERSRPDARVIALVGTLAAFGALGRIAFAALPNIKPTTDIVFVAGYALGGAPGFVVGAVSGLTSNFFFGQGPWTPWQMGAWGVTGLLGAGFAILTRRRMNRWLLAAVCGIVGFAFTACQDFGDWVTYSDHSLVQLGVYVGKGIGFDFVHAAGCVVFALAFGPALARSIERFVTRLRVDWRPLEPAGLSVLAAALAIVAVGAGLGPHAARAGGTPASYLLSAENADGGFGPAPGSPSSDLYSGWAALGLASEGIDLRTVSHGRLIAYIESSESSNTDPGSIERTILVLRAAGLSAGSLVAALQHDIGSDGSVSNQTNLTSFAILALRAAGVTPPANTVSWLSAQQDADGGFNFATKGGQSDVDDTGAALEALAAAGAPVKSRALAFISHQQNGDGGYPSQPGGPSNAQSTAWAIQGLLASGTSTASLGRPLGYLQSLTGPNGAVDYSKGNSQSPVWVTGEAMMALAGKPLPLAPPPTAVRHAAAHVRAAAKVAKATRPKAHKRKRERARQSGARSPLRRLAADIAVLDALTLAPVG